MSDSFNDNIRMFLLLSIFTSEVKSIILKVLFVTDDIFVP